MKHKHGKRSSKEQLGFLQKPKGSRSYCIVDKNSDKNLKIRRAELQKALPGDLVRYHITPKGWASIDITLESNTKNFIGKLQRKGKTLFSSPIGLEDVVRIKITDEVSKKASADTLVEVIITKQPTSKSIGEGYVKRLISKDNILEQASALSIAKYNLKTEWNKSIIKESQLLSKMLISLEEGCVDLRKKSKTLAIAILKKVQNK